MDAIVVETNKSANFQKYSQIVVIGKVCQKKIMKLRKERPYIVLMCQVAWWMLSKETRKQNKGVVCFVG